MSKSKTTRYTRTIVSGNDKLFYSLTVLKQCLIKIAKEFTFVWVCVVMLAYLVSAANIILLGALPAVYIFATFLYSYIKDTAGPRYVMDEDDNLVMDDSQIDNTSTLDKNF